LFLKNHIKLNTINSTNEFLENLINSSKLDHNIIVSTSFQENGRGQFGKSWESEKNKNLLTSLLINHESNIKDNFKFNISISIAICNFLEKYFNSRVKIKWPNDIMIDDKKIAGVLIKNLQSNSKSIIGIGLNINQVDFNLYTPEATSFKKEKKIKFNVDELFNELLNSIEYSYNNFKNDLNLKDEFLKKLYKFNVQTKFKFNNSLILATISDVSDNGELVTIDEHGKIRKFKNGEIKFLF
jgi:BirA family biotin operon repressor/biotin-[acetyl-CoA-carboxylase] ligase